MKRLLPRICLLATVVGASLSAQRTPIPQQLVFTPYHASGIYDVGETVGWTVLSGQQFEPNVGAASARTTIVNLKLGTRITKGPHSVYGGWGFALTDDRWYEDIVRLEYRRVF